MRRCLALSSIVILIAALAAWEPAGAQDASNPCPQPIDLGELSDTLSTTGTWTASECDASQFLENRPGVLYRFTLAEEAEVRIDLSSPDRDALLYLQSEDGTLIDSDDDTGGEGDARIERKNTVGVR